MRSASSRGGKAISPTPTQRLNIGLAAANPSPEALAKIEQIESPRGNNPDIMRTSLGYVTQAPATESPNRTPASVASESMAHPLQLLEQARRCRRLADDCTDGEVRETLLRL